MKAFALAAAAAILFAPTARADDVQGYLNALEGQGIYASSGEGTLVMAGQMVCNDLSEGSTPMQTARKVYQSTDASFSSEDSGYLVGAAIAALCPEYLYMIPR